MLGGIFSSVQTLLSRLTSTRAGYLDKLNVGSAASSTNYTSTRGAKLDNLDIAVTGIAPASTAVSNATVSNARIQNLDNMDVALSTRLTSVINSIQRGYVAVGNASYTYVTVNSVVTSKAVLLITHRVSSGTSVCPWKVFPSAEIVNSTSIRFIYPSGGGGEIAWQLVEFK